MDLLLVLIVLLLVLAFLGGGSVFAFGLAHDLIWLFVLLLLLGLVLGGWRWWGTRAGPPPY